VAGAELLLFPHFSVLLHSLIIDTMDDSYLAMAGEAAFLCSSIQVQLAELAAMEAAGATEVKAGTSNMEPSPSAPGTSVMRIFI
jgi:hypothetical protein